MDEEYLDVSLDDVYDELMNYNISLKDVASIYKFPSEKVLKKVLKNYCRKLTLPLPRQIENPEKFFTEQEQEIYQLSEQYHIPATEIANKYKMTTQAVHKILKKFDETDKEKRPKTFVNSSMSENIKLEKETSKNKEENKSNNHSKKIEIPKQEAIDAFLNHDYSKYSATTVRKRLKEMLGENYYIILKGDKLGEQTKEFVKLYEEGKTFNEIAQMYNVTSHVVRDRLNHYYKNMNLKRPKIMSKKEFYDYINGHDNINIEDMLESFKKINIHIPEPYIQEYYKKIGEIDFRKVKAIVNREFLKLQKENITPNFITPFDFANEVKSKGYNTKYQAAALFYKMIVDNNLSIDIISELEDDDITEALHILLDLEKTDKVNYLRNIQNNKIAKLIYSIENKTYYLDYEKD